MKNSVKLEEIVYFLCSSKDKYDKWIKYLLMCESLRKYVWLFKLIGQIYQLSNLKKLNKEILVFWCKKLFEENSIDKLKFEFVCSIVERFPEKITPIIIESLIEKFVVRSIVDNFYDNLVMNNNLTAESVLNELWRASSVIKELNSYSVDYDIDEILSSGSFEVGGKIGVSLLDEFLTGYPKSGYTIVAGKTGIGKTYFLLNSFVESLKAGYSAIFISPEMSYRAIINRLAMLTTGYKHEHLRGKPILLVDDLPLPHNVEAIRDDRIDYDNAREVFKNEWYYEKELEQRIVCSDMSGNLIGLHTIESSVIDMLERDKKVDIIFIDAPEMLSVKWAKNEFDEIQQKSLFFNKLAIEYNIAVVVSWQFKKDTYKKKCNLSISDVKGRNEIAQKASLILALIQDTPEKMLNLLRIETLKVRHDVPTYPPPIIISSAIRLGKYVMKEAIFDNKKISAYMDRLSEIAGIMDMNGSMVRDFNTYFEDEADEEFPF